MKKLLALLLFVPSLAFAQTLSGPQTTTPSLAINGCTIGANALCVTGTVNLAGPVFANSLTLSQGNPDVALVRDAANTLALRNGTNPQTFNLYNTYTDASNYERGFLRWNTNTLQIGDEAAGTGAARSFCLTTQGNSRFCIDASGNFVAAADATYNIGASGANRPNNGYFAGVVQAAGNVVTTGGSVLINNNAGSYFLGASNDVAMSRCAAACVQHGGADAASPVAQTIQAQSVVAGTTNTAAPNFTIAAPKGTGTGAGGSIIFQVAPAGTTGTTQNALASALTIDSTKQATFGGNVVAGPITINALGNTAVSFAANNTYDIGTSATYARNTYTGNLTAAFNVSAGSGANIGWTSRALMSSPADGQVQIANNAGTNTATLAADAANTLALRNGTNAQTFNVYNTYTDASNYERGALYGDGSGLRIDWQNAGTGSGRGIYMGLNGTRYFGVNGTLAFWNVNAAGSLLAGTDNSFNIGANGASRPNTIYVGAGGIVTSGTIFLNNGTRVTDTAGGTISIGNSTNSFLMTASGSGNVTFGGGVAVGTNGLTVAGPAQFTNGSRITDTANGTFQIGNTTGTNTFTVQASGGGAATFGGNVVASALVASASSYYGWLGRSVMFSDLDGKIRLSNNAASGFTMLQLGGTTSSFPALKVNGTELQFRLADDSAPSDMRANNVFALGYVGESYTTVAGLITCNAANHYKEVWVTDATQTFSSANFGVTPTGGGTNSVPVKCDGTSWKIG